MITRNGRAWGRPTVAQVVLSEIGWDMSRFPTVGHLLSWAGLCPRQDESAGKKRSTRIKKGAPWLKTTLVQAAWAAVRKKGSYLGSLYQSNKNRRGSKNKAIIAVAASLLTSIYFMLKRGEPYKELGASFRDHRDKTRTAARLIRRVKALGFNVQLVKDAASPTLQPGEFLTSSLPTSWTLENENRARNARWGEAPAGFAGRRGRAEPPFSR